MDCSTELIIFTSLITTTKRKNVWRDNGHSDIDLKKEMETIQIYNQNL